MLKQVQKTVLVVAGLAAAALGGSALAGAASNTSTTTGTTTTQTQGQPPAGVPGDRGPRGDRQPLSASVAAKVKQAALDKVPGATVLRTEAGGPYNSAYHAHIKTSDGKLEVVLVNESFEATAVQADNGRGPGGRGGYGGPGAGEKSLTGTTKDKVEAAVLDKYPGATIERTETNVGGDDAPYESHITTKDGKQLEVHVNKDFEVVSSSSGPQHP